MTDETVIGAIVNKNLFSREKLYSSTFSYHIGTQNDLLFMENGFAADGSTYPTFHMFFFWGGAGSGGVEIEREFPVHLK